MLSNTRMSSSGEADCWGLISFRLARGGGQLEEDWMGTGKARSRAVHSVFSQVRCWGPQRETWRPEGELWGAERERLRRGGVRGWAENKDTVQFLFCFWSLLSGKNDCERGGRMRWLWEGSLRSSPSGHWGGEAPNLELPNGGAYCGSKPLSFGVPLHPHACLPVVPYCRDFLHYAYAGVLCC